MNIDEKLLKKAKDASGAKTDTEAVRLGLEQLVRRAAIERLIAYQEPDAQDVPRRRPETQEDLENDPGQTSESRRIA